MTNAYLDLHVLQSVPPSNVNRDETGSPKTAIYGGHQRARVSSQAIKHAVRLDFASHLDPSDLGVRSKRLVAKIVDRIGELDPDLQDTAEQFVADMLKTIDIKVEKPKRAAKEGSEIPSAESEYLIFLSNQQIESLAEYAVATQRAGGKPVKKDVASRAASDLSFDIALFGRMVADVTDLRVDAAAQVAHAISVHAVQNEFDYFTAVDDNASGEHAGAGMIGTIEFNSSTLYRYATVNINALSEHLGDVEATSRAVSAFVRSFVRSMPTGKQNTFANRTLPHAVVATLRTDQPINLVGAFETPVEAAGSESRLKRAADALVTHANEIEAAYGSPADTRTWVLAVGGDVASLKELGEPVTFDELVQSAAEAARALVEAS